MSNLKSRSLLVAISLAFTTPLLAGDDPIHERHELMEGVGDAAKPIGQMLNAWEIWYYYSDHTKYVFVDREGFGEFVLHEVSRI